MYICEYRMRRHFRRLLTLSKPAPALIKNILTQLYESSRHEANDQPHQASCDCSSGWIVLREALSIDMTCYLSRGTTYKTEPAEDPSCNRDTQEASAFRSVGNAQERQERQEEDSEG